MSSSKTGAEPEHSSADIARSIVAKGALDDYQQLAAALAHLGPLLPAAGLRPDPKTTGNCVQIVDTVKDGNVTVATNLSAAARQIDRISRSSLLSARQRDARARCAQYLREIAVHVANPPPEPAAEEPVEQPGEAAGQPAEVPAAASGATVAAKPINVRGVARGSSAEPHRRAPKAPAHRKPPELTQNPLIVWDDVLSQTLSDTAALSIRPEAMGGAEPSPASEPAAERAAPADGGADATELLESTLAAEPPAAPSHEQKAPEPRLRELLLPLLPPGPTEQEITRLMLELLRDEELCGVPVPGPLLAAAQEMTTLAALRDFFADCLRRRIPPRSPLAALFDDAAKSLDRVSQEWRDGALA